ncbi:membrane hypothetical protein [Rhodospirillaceae bacterium LM-1]|nr:membrane hypothetical protein [Rhodospirillaceae bacterium LM-1]
MEKLTNSIASASLPIGEPWGNGLGLVDAIMTLLSRIFDAGGTTIDTVYKVLGPVSYMIAAGGLIIVLVIEAMRFQAASMEGGGPEKPLWRLGKLFLVAVIYGTIAASPATTSNFLREWIYQPIMGTGLAVSSSIVSSMSLPSSSSANPYCGSGGGGTWEREKAEFLCTSSSLVKAVALPITLGDLAWQKAASSTVDDVRLALKNKSLHEQELAAAVANDSSVLGKIAEARAAMVETDSSVPDFIKSGVDNLGIRAQLIIVAMIYYALGLALVLVFGLLLASLVVQVFLFSSFFPIVLLGLLFSPLRPALETTIKGIAASAITLVGWSIVVSIMTNLVVAQIGEVLNESVASLTYSVNSNGGQMYDSASLLYGQLAFGSVMIWVVIFAAGSYVLMSMAQGVAAALTGGHSDGLGAARSAANAVVVAAAVAAGQVAGKINGAISTDSLPQGGGNSGEKSSPFLKGSGDGGGPPN